MGQSVIHSRLDTDISLSISSYASLCMNRTDLRQKRAAANHNDLLSISCLSRDDLFAPIEACQGANRTACDRRCLPATSS